MDDPKLYRFTVACDEGEGETLRHALGVEASNHVAEGMTLTWSPDSATVHVLTETPQLVTSIIRRLAPRAVVNVASPPPSPRPRRESRRW